MNPVKNDNKINNFEDLFKLDSTVNGSSWQSP